jgi:4-hydroxybenzoate polyprenyltransferase
VTALARAGHAGPCLVLATIMTAVTARGSVTLGDLVVFGIAVLAGQLSIGWSNDFFDASRDAAAGRRDKPIVTGQISRTSTIVAAVVALMIGAALSFWLSLRTGVVHAAMMTAGWTYNAGLKRTAWSGLAYAVGFGLVPVLATTMWPGQPRPQAWTITVAVLLGLGGHFANAIPDLEGDRLAGVGGLPQRVATSRLGPTAVRFIAISLLVVASLILAVVARAPRAVTPTVIVVLSVIIAFVGLSQRGRTPFHAALAIAVVDVALFVRMTGTAV